LRLSIGRRTKRFHTFGAPLIRPNRLKLLCLCRVGFRLTPGGVATRNSFISGLLSLSALLSATSGIVLVLLTALTATAALLPAALSRVLLLTALLVLVRVCQ
jgi:integral membrane sensor domain MASE1